MRTSEGVMIGGKNQEVTVGTCALSCALMFVAGKWPVLMFSLFLCE